MNATGVSIEELPADMRAAIIVERTEKISAHIANLRGTDEARASRAWSDLCKAMEKADFAARVYFELKRRCDAEFSWDSPEEFLSSFALSARDGLGFHYETKVEIPTEIAE